MFLGLTDATPHTETRSDQLPSELFGPCRDRSKQRILLYLTYLLTYTNYRLVKKI